MSRIVRDDVEDIDAELKKLDEEYAKRRAELEQRRSEAQRRNSNSHAHHNTKSLEEGVHGNGRGREDREHHSSERHSQDRRPDRRHSPDTPYDADSDKDPLRHRDPFHVDPREITLLQKKNWATKYWFSFPISEKNVQELRKASEMIGEQFGVPNLAIGGWVIISDYLYYRECGSLLADFQRICAELCELIEFRHTYYHLVGDHSDKPAALYQPFNRTTDKLDEPLFEQFVNRMRDLVRDAARRLAEKEGAFFNKKIDTDRATTVEGGEMRNIRIYEMRLTCVPSLPLILEFPSRADGFTMRATRRHRISRALYHGSSDDD